MTVKADLLLAMLRALKRKERAGEPILRLREHSDFLSHEFSISSDLASYAVTEAFGQILDGVFNEETVDVMKAIRDDMDNTKIGLVFKIAGTTPEKAIAIFDAAFTIVGNDLFDGHAEMGLKTTEFAKRAKDAADVAVKRAQEHTP